MQAEAFTCTLDNRTTSKIGRAETGKTLNNNSNASVVIPVFNTTEQVSSHNVCANSRRVHAHQMLQHYLTDKLLSVFPSSAGIGRTGTFIVIDILLGMLQNYGTFSIA